MPPEQPYKVATGVVSGVVLTRQNIGQVQSRVQRGAKEARSPVKFKIRNFLIIEIIGFCLATSSHKSNFHANHAHHTHHAQNWSVEPLSDFRLDPPLKSVSNQTIFALASDTDIQLYGSHENTI